VTAWLHRQIAFQHEALSIVAAEFSRYSPAPIVIESPELRALAVSGVFNVDDTESFVAFLRSLKGVGVEVTPTRIRVFKP
jgi:transmembrane sensor